MKSFLLIATGILGFAILGSCSYVWNFKAGPEANVIVILVENLGVQNLICDDIETEKSGFKVFCEEGVRFTHAFAPSTLSQATLASILTGLYPYEHQVRTNGSNGLSARVVTAAETALEKGFRTSFFSGGAPLLRRNGLNQGFEIFDDNINLSLRRFYRPASEVNQLFLNWFDSEVTRKSRAFSFLHYADLQFGDIATENEAGEQRELSYRSQFEEVDESLYNLVTKLKSKGVWNNSWVFLVGLNGIVEEEREHQLRGASLFNETTHVSFFVKRPGFLLQKETKSLAKLDGNISLTDVGATLFNILGETNDDEGKHLFSIHSLLPLLKNQKDSFDWDRRPVLVESAWPSWRNLGQDRLAVRVGQYLYLHNSKGQVFDSFSDGFEVSELGEDSKVWALRSQLRMNLNQLGFGVFDMSLKPGFAKFESARLIFDRKSKNLEVMQELKRLSLKFEKDAEIFSWRALFALKNQDWPELKEVGRLAGERSWEVVAQRNMGKNNERLTDKCFQFLQESTIVENTRVVPRECGGNELLDLRSWLDETQMASVRQKGFDAFFRWYFARLIERRIVAYNYTLDFIWDTKESHLLRPTTAELFLSLPENRYYWQLLKKRLI